MAQEEIDALCKEWTTLYQTTLPSLARDREPAQKSWPVVLDHCFARIILDNTVGKGANPAIGIQQWDNVIKKPAIKNMTTAQLHQAISLGKQIQNGEVDLQELDRSSLTARGKNEAKYSGKRKVQQDEVDNAPLRSKKQKSGKQQSTLSFMRAIEQNGSNRTSSQTPSDQSETHSRLEEDLKTTSTPDIEATVERIRTQAGLTAFRRRLYAALLTVPRGEYTTYQAMADFLNSSARAVGNGMRNNPFAPDVPCHRVVASDRSLGGFGGDWGKDGKHAHEKIQLLKDEGVKFDSVGKVRGPIFRSFIELPID